MSHPENVYQFPVKRSALHEQEARVLGAVLASENPRELFDKSGLSPGDFADRRIGNAWGIARGIAIRKGIVRASTVHSAAKGLLEVGELGWLAELEAGNMIQALEFSQIADDLRARHFEQSYKLKLQGHLNAIEARGLNVAEASGFHDAARDELVQKLGPEETPATDVVHQGEIWDTNEQTGKAQILKTAIKVLDDEIGGLPPKLSILAGNSGGGKTATLATMIRSQLESDPEITIGLFGLEDGTEWLADRWVCDLMGMRLVDLKNRKRTPEERALYDEVAPYVYKMLTRIVSYNHGKINTRDLLQRAANWLTMPRVVGGQTLPPCSVVYVDNMTWIEHRGAQSGDAYWQGVSQTVDAIAMLAHRLKKPIVLLCHTIEDGARGVEGPPKMSAMAGGRSIDRYARLMLGLWTKGHEWRCTVLKSNIGKAGGTIEFLRKADPVLIDPSGGRIVNVAAEKRAEREAKRDNAAVESLARSKKKAELIAAEKTKAADPAPPEPQASLDLEKP